MDRWIKTYWRAGTESVGAIGGSLEARQERGDGGGKRIEGAIVIAGMGDPL